jgi:flavin-dependent dehydrogenase
MEYGSGNSLMSIECDVAVIGGGPGGSTVGALLLKYNPRLNVQIFEREVFPRDHVGESHLPVISNVLNEMEVWDNVEAAGFPIKIGATYRWGRTTDLWDFEFLPDGKLKPEPRPAKFEGQRRRTAFQVDRSLYDKILLDRAAEWGCHVHENTAVRRVHASGDRVDRLELSDGTQVCARYYLDCSGASGLLRRTMGVEAQYPSALHNIAIWDYWQNAEWAVSVGVGGTRIQILSLPYGWIWFIPLGPQRTSIGLVTPAAYFKEQGKRPEDLYLAAVQSDPVVNSLLRHAKRERKLATTKDWSFVAERLAGENWFLIGDTAGFADPILSAGLSLTHYGARHVAYSILALDRADYEPDWIRHLYSDTQRTQIKQHIRFAEYWYTANGVFSDLKEHAKTIATEAGLNLSAEQAWQWLGQGGFINRSSSTELALYGLLLSKEILASFSGDEPFFEITGKTHFRTNLDNSSKEWTAELKDGRITRYRAYSRNGKVLPMIGQMGWLARRLQTEHDIHTLARSAHEYHTTELSGQGSFVEVWTDFIKTLEALVSDGWVSTRAAPDGEPMPPPRGDFSQIIHANRDQGPKDHAV